ncbi:prenyltransferase/squalene oxidase repeat-containing protein [Kutzneria sp. CA-103260]|uniref:prenyltransferase/squalene oxidase repeat-containing protein n=1 Tax=Kutzneria sp. CA-103260 TaxID=2802641 RepID=UPI001BA81A6C|nr:prenyltransferase/squalene oxidase repeat-containing protein [Kutzneria sp. CA-103260]QUQ68840.1 Prenyltransferase and squalene oxidase repeat protein [Kutzneria sp. CA-103260]
MTAAAPLRESAPGGVGSGEADLWCTYAAVRTLRWLDRLDVVADRDGTARYLAGRRNADGGYAWTRGMPSDAWATFYCTQALTDLGEHPAALDRTAEWLRGTWSGEAYAMQPGQRPDVWATHFSTRTAIDVCGIEPADPARLLDWLAGLQTDGGGLSWSPEHGIADVRACHYGVTVWSRLNALRPTPQPWRTDALVDWLRGQCGEDGGFRFSPDAQTPCLWATYRACSALELLGWRAERATADWIANMRGPHGSFVRWADHTVEDVWAAFCAIGSLRSIGAPVDEFAPAVAARIAALACPDGGYTYREPDRAADVLSTAAAVLRSPDDAGVAWLSSCQLPNEGGLMYMPARGAEVRCTLWGLAAGALADNPDGRATVARWLRRLQNPDGGFGLWEGRGSEMVSTIAAVDTVGLLGLPLSSTIDTGRLAAFLDSCRHGNGFRPVPAAEPTLRSGLQGLRALAALGRPDPTAVADLLAAHRVSGGGFASTGNRVPDLLSTYEAVLAADRHGLPVDESHIRRFLGRVSTPGTAAWSPLAPGDGGPLAHCLSVLLNRRFAAEAAGLPPLVLS